MHHFFKHKKKGFSITELIVVIAVVAILAALAVPHFLGRTRQARLTKLSYDGKLIEQAVSKYNIATAGQWPKLGGANAVPLTREQIVTNEGILHNLEMMNVTLSNEEHNRHFWNRIGQDYIDSNGRLYPRINLFAIDKAAINPYLIRMTSDIRHFVLRNPTGIVYFRTTIPEPQAPAAPLLPPVAAITMTPNQNITTTTPIAWSHLNSTDPQGLSIVAAEWQNNQSTFPAPGKQTTRLRVQNSARIWSEWVETTFPVLPNMRAQTFGGSADDWFHYVTQTSDGGFVAVGESSSAGLNRGGGDAIIARYDSSGNLLWNRNFGGSDWDGFINVQQVLGGFVATGWAWSTDGDLVGLGRGGRAEATIVKYDNNGNHRWTRTFGGIGSDWFIDIEQTADGGFLATGTTGSFGIGWWRGYIVKTDSNGNLQWQRDFGGTSENRFRRGEQMPNGNFIFVGYSNSTDGPFTGLNRGGWDAIVVQYDQNGNFQWVRNFGGSGNDQFFSMEQTPDGGLIAAGWSDSANGHLAGLNRGTRDAIIARYDSSGNLLWNRNFGGSNTEAFHSVNLTATGGFIVAGESHSTDGYLTGFNMGGQDAVISEYDGTGNLLWNGNFGGSNNEWFSAVLQKINGGFVAAGRSNSTNGHMTGLNRGAMDATLVKYTLN